MTPKDKKIIEDAERLGIPIFVLTAKDMCSTNTIGDYYKRCFKVECSKEHLNGIIHRKKEFDLWQLQNQGKVKLPD
jgi:hypothetical protein